MKWFSAIPWTEGEMLVSIGSDVGCFDQSAEALLAEVAGAKAIHLMINSSGGDALTALAVHDGIRDRCSEATIHGRCFSAAVILAMSAQKISIASDARLMIHQARAAVYGIADELIESAQQLQKTNERQREILKARTGNAFAVDTWLNGKDHYFTAAEALAVGLVDAIFEPCGEVRNALASSPACLSEEEAGKSLLDVLEAIGPIKTTDRAKLMRNVHVLLSQNILEE